MANRLVEVIQTMSIRIAAVIVLQLSFCKAVRFMACMIKSRSVRS